MTSPYKHWQPKNCLALASLVRLSLRAAFRTPSCEHQATDTARQRGTVQMQRTQVYGPKTSSSILQPEAGESPMTIRPHGCTRTTLRIPQNTGRRAAHIGLCPGSTASTLHTAPAAPAPYNVLTRFWAARRLRTSEILGTLCATRRRARQFVATPRPLPESPQCTPHHRLQPPRCSRPTARPRIPCLPAQSPATSATNRRAP